MSDRLPSKVIDQVEAMLEAGGTLIIPDAVEVFPDVTKVLASDDPSIPAALPAAE